jgi:hypothetical protein
MPLLSLTETDNARARWGHGRVRLTARRLGPCPIHLHLLLRPLIIGRSPGAVSKRQAGSEGGLRPGSRARRRSHLQQQRRLVSHPGIRRSCRPGSFLGQSQGL